MYHRCQLVVEYAAPQTLPGIIITAKSILGQYKNFNKLHCISFPFTL